MLFENNGVYINYSDELFNFHKLEDAEKLIKIDLDNQEIYQDKEDNEDNNLSEEIMNKHDYITLNYFPLSVTHTNLTINIDQKFPQVLSDEFIQQVLQIFTLANNPTLRCGYDSLGGGCIINHLHFEILFLDDFSDLKKMPIEVSPATEIFSTKFVNLNPE